MNKTITAAIMGIVVIGGAAAFFINRSVIHKNDSSLTITDSVVDEKPKSRQFVDKAAYDAKMEALANNPEPVPVPASSTSTTTTEPVIEKTGWPVEGLPYPYEGALLPYHRIIAFYGNFYSKKMGILGQYPADVVLEKLAQNVKDWNAADPSIPAMPAIHYIASTAQKDPGADKKYTFRMPKEQIQKALDLADKAKAITFLDIQIGHSTVQEEIPRLEEYLKQPTVHLGIDPEFAMKNGKVPGTVVGSLDASEINWAMEYLAKLVRENNLPPKILVIHRFTQDGVMNYDQIKPLPEVQIVIHMDGWGSPDHKKTTYKHVIYPEPVQFAGLKIFYGNDMLKPSTRLITPAEILKLQPIPIYIQYQ
ncbi:MAG: hypothetical protein WCG20_01380 [bacterium]